MLSGFHRSICYWAIREQAGPQVLPLVTHVDDALLPPSVPPPAHLLLNAVPGPPPTRSTFLEASQTRHDDLIHYDNHRLNKGCTTGVRGDKARIIVPTTNTPTTSAIVKATNLSTPHPDDKRSPSLLPWSMGYWPGTHHLWVGSLLCAQITGVVAPSRRGPTVVALRVR